MSFVNEKKVTKGLDRDIVHARIQLEGIVQGVGFRPFVCRLAHSLEINGWVMNSPEGITIEAECRRHLLKRFLSALNTKKPKHARIKNCRVEFSKPVGIKGFQMKSNEST